MLSRLAFPRDLIGSLRCYPRVTRCLESIAAMSDDRTVPPDKAVRKKRKIRLRLGAGLDSCMGRVWSGIGEEYQANELNTSTIPIQRKAGAGRQGAFSLFPGARCDRHEILLEAERKDTRAPPNK